MLKLKRAYDSAHTEDGPRFLVERLWPRGVKKTALQVKAWLKEVAPSPELRRWYGHDTGKWVEFQKRYRAELDRHPEACNPILEAARRGTVTLVYAARDTEHNSAAVLRDYLEKKLTEKRRPTRKAAT